MPFTPPPPAEILEALEKLEPTRHHLKAEKEHGSPRNGAVMRTNGRRIRITGTLEESLEATRLPSGPYRISAHTIEGSPALDEKGQPIPAFVSDWTLELDDDEATNLQPPVIAAPAGALSPPAGAAASGGDPELAELRAQRAELVRRRAIAAERREIEREAAELAMLEGGGDAANAPARASDPALAAILLRLDRVLEQLAKNAAAPPRDDALAIVKAILPELVAGRESAKRPSLRDHLEDLEMLRALRDEVRGEGDGNEPSRDLMEKVVSMLTEALRSRRDGEPAATSTTSARPAIAPAARTTSDAAPSARARERVDAFLEQLDEECANASDPESLAPEMVDAIGLLPPALREAIYTGADLSVVADALSPYPSAALSRFGERLGTPKVQEWLASLVVAIRTEHAARTAPAAEPASPAVAAAAPAVSSAGEPALPRDEPPRSRVGAAPARAAAAPNGRAA